MNSHLHSDQREKTHKWAGNMLMFHVDVNKKRLGIHFKNDSFRWFRVDSFFWETITLYTVHFQSCVTHCMKGNQKIHNRGTLNSNLMVSEIWQNFTFYCTFLKLLFISIVQKYFFCRILSNRSHSLMDSILTYRATELWSTWVQVLTGCPFPLPFLLSNPFLSY